MKKAVFIALSAKKDQQVLDDIALTPQQRVDRMFDLMHDMALLTANVTMKPGENCIILRKRNGSLSKRS